MRIQGSKTVPAETWTLGLNAFSCLASFHQCKTQIKIIQVDKSGREKTHIGKNIDKMLQSHKQLHTSHNMFD